MYFHISYQDPPKLVKKYSVGYTNVFILYVLHIIRYTRKYDIYFIPYIPYNKLILKKTLFNQFK